MRAVAAMVSLAAAAAAVGCVTDETDDDGGASVYGTCEDAKCDTWGVDNRKDLYAVQRGEVNPETIKSLAHSTGSMIMKTWSARGTDGSLTFPNPLTLGRRYALCPDQRFTQQPAEGFCTGFLAGPDVFVTAGHCLHAMHADPVEACKKFVVAFDYGYFSKPDSEGALLAGLPAQNVFDCKKVEAYAYTPAAGGYYDDYAVIRLDRPTGRRPLAYRKSGEIPVGSQVFTIGSPSGIPLKFSGGGKVQPGPYTSPEAEAASHLNHFVGFFYDLDIFGGNSGGPVFNLQTAEVEGVPTAYSGKNYVQRKGASCYEVAVCGVNADCPIYPGAFSTAQFADKIDAAVAAH